VLQNQYSGSDLSSPNRPLFARWLEAHGKRKIAATANQGTVHSHIEGGEEKKRKRRKTRKLAA